MRPYLAIIRDSFHEALASRVLWILLAIVTLVLALLFPLGLREQAGSMLNDEDIINRDRFIEKIVTAGKSEEPSPGKRVWDLLDESTRRSMERNATAKRGERGWSSSGVDAIQKLLKQRDF